MYSVIFRRGLADRPHWPEWARGSGIGEIVDATDRDCLAISSVGAENLEVSCAGVPLTEFEALLYLGTPGAFALRYPVDRERLYVHQEWESALLAALAALPPGRLINPGFPFSWNRSLFDPVHMIRDLAVLGWSTPRVQKHFDFITGLVQKVRQPEPTESQKRLLIVTAHEVVFGDRPGEPLPAACSKAVAATQRHLSQWRLDWVTLALADVEGRWIAYGLQPDLPECLPPEVASRLLAEVHSRRMAGVRTQCS